jgi:hypothetical protein
LPVAALLMVGAPAVAQDAATSKLSSAPGIQVASFRLEAGTVYVNLPDDMAPGETVGATVNPIPTGPDAEARERQREKLAGYAVELAGQRAAASERVRTFRVPASAVALAIRLVDPRGRAAGELEAALRPGPPPPADYTVPDLGQSGAPMQVGGSFDGDLSNSSVRIDGRDAEPIAESPRQLVVRGPQVGAADATVEVRERGTVVTTGSYRNVHVKLSAGATALRSGQETTLTVTVTGVEGLREALPVRLTNGSPTVVRVEGGDEQTLCVRPDEVKVDGSWKADRGLTGLKFGGFVIGTEVSQPGPHAESWAAISGDVQGDLRARLLLEDPARSVSGQTVAAGPYAVLVRGAGEGGRVRLLLGRRGQEAVALDGAVFQRLPSSAPCDRDDASEGGQRLRAGTGRPGFSDLGFEHDQMFAVRDAEGGRRLVLETEEEHFSIEADLAALRP